MDQAIAAFAQRPVSEKIEVLLQLAHALTILARETYEVAGTGVTQPPDSAA